MRRPDLRTPLDHDRSRVTGWTRAHWEEAFQELMTAIVDSASPGGARQRIPGPRSHHGQLADELEGFTRSLIMAGPWMATSGVGSYIRNGRAIDVAGFYRRGILAGTDPRHPEYWGEIHDYAQHLVEMAALAWGLYLSRDLIWDTLSTSDQKQVADYMHQCTRVAYHHNNWLLFNVVTNAVLKRLGMPYSQEQIDQNLEACEHMYIGDGWYRDGNINRIDYYNAWAFLYYYLIWVILDGDSNPAAADRYRERARAFTRDFRYFVAGDGSVPCFGRSMIYRFGSLAPVTLAQHMGCLDLSPGEVRAMCSGLLKFFFTQEILTESGHLSMGFLRPCASMLEHYSCGGSPYWAGKAFNLLLIPAADGFWMAEEEPLPIHQGDFSVPLQSAGLLMVGSRSSGHVQLVNQKSYHDKPEYNDKYTKFAYSSIFSYESRQVHGSFNCDNVLQFSEDGVNFQQRWEMENLHCEEDFAASRYALHQADPEGRATTAILVKGDVMVNVHHIRTTKRLVFREGGYPLGFDDGKARTVSIEGAEAAYKDGKLTFIRRLHGYDRQSRAIQFGDDVNGSNVRYRQSVVPVVGYENPEPGEYVLVSMVCGRVGDDSIESLAGLVSQCEVGMDGVRITFADGERAWVRTGEPRETEVSLNGVSFSGSVVMARASADGSRSSVVQASRTTEAVR